jgi:hypothetical protein
MANMELIDVKTLSSTAASITFSAIPQTYTDLKILVSARDDRDGQPNTDLSLQVGYNETINTGSIYSAKQLYGSGSTAGSQSSATTYLYLGMSNGPTSTASTFGNTEIYILNYTSANNKSVSTDGVSENNASTAYAVLNAGLISTSNPITDIKISAVYGSGNFVSGSTFYLYGISNVTSTAKATGGIVSSDETYWYHMFPFSGTFTPTAAITADYLVLAGGGGGSDGGSGGAGGARSTLTWTGGGYSLGSNLESALSLTAQAYTITVGAGGTKGTTTTNGTKGSDSVFSTITSNGGGAGKEFGSSPTSNQNGGSGAGGINSAGSGQYIDGGTGTTAQGNIGGRGFRTSSGYNAAGGGGGANGNGADGSGTGNQAIGGNGGAGIYTALTNFFQVGQVSGGNYYIAGGGGGGAEDNLSNTIAGTGGLGGGGNGSKTTGVDASNATINTGGGGGGGMTNSSNGGTGGSGIVIVRYAK